MLNRQPQPLFTDDDYRQFANDIDHVIKVADTCTNENQLDGVNRMVHGLRSKYTRFHGLLNHRKTTIVSDDGLVYLQVKLEAKRDVIREKAQELDVA